MVLGPFRSPFGDKVALVRHVLNRPMDALRGINASKASSKGILEYSMIVVIPFEPTLVVNTSFTVVTSKPANAASCPATLRQAALYCA